MISDLFFYLELVLEQPSQVNIDNFSLSLSSQGQSVTITAIDDVHEWIWTKAYPTTTSIPADPLPKTLQKRGDPVRGWIHFPLPNISGPVLQTLSITLKVNCKHGTCYIGIDGSWTSPDAGIKGMMWNRKDQNT
jgi:hypothetical protein